LIDIGTAPAQAEERVAIAALHELRGVGKTTLAAAYAELHRGDYRATNPDTDARFGSFSTNPAGFVCRLMSASPQKRPKCCVAAK
jgi:hypothetical protein